MSQATIPDGFTSSRRSISSTGSMPSPISSTKDRTDLLVDAIREYIEDTADSETFQELVATKYYDDQLEFETVKQLVGAETAQRLRLLKADLEDEPLDLATPNDVDVYDGDVTTVDTAVDDDR